MYCLKCGNACSDTQKFCNKCGAPLQGNGAAAAANQQPVAPVYQAPAEKGNFAEPKKRPESILTYLGPQTPKTVGIGKWALRIIVSFLPVIVTYFLTMLLETGLYDKIIGIIGDGSVKPLVIVLLGLIAVSVVIQVVSLIAWASKGKGDATARNWALGFIIVAIAVTVLLILADVGMVIFADTKFLQFTSSYLSPVSFIRTLISVL